MRSLDATEYLGPVRLISSYRDPHARGTVRVDVDLAEDVPNRVRQDGSRLYWEFNKPTPSSGQKLPALGGPLPPSVLFVPARRVAGFSVTLPAAGTRARAEARGGQGGGPSRSPRRGSRRAPPREWSGPGCIPPRKAGEDESPAARRASLTAKKRYTGRRIDLDFKGADIHNILRLLADVGQMNIVTSDEVKGEVTIKMRDVPWDQALDVVLRAKGLGSVREGNLVRVAPLSVLEKELEQEIARQKQITEVLPTETRLIGVSYAHASSLQDKARDLLSPRGKISVDDRTNNLIVSDVARNLQLIEDLVRNLDTQTSQVVIEARIVEMNSDLCPPDRHPVGWKHLHGCGARQSHGAGFPLQHWYWWRGRRQQFANVRSGSRSPNRRCRRGKSKFPGQHACPSRPQHRKCHRPHHGVSGRGLQLESAPFGHGVHRHSPHRVLAADHHDGQHRCCHRTGCVDPGIGRQRDGRPDPVRGCQAPPGGQAACHQRGHCPAHGHGDQ